MAIREHRRQTFWQVLFPVILLSLVIIAVIVFLIITTGGAGNDVDTRWANISLIWLIIPTMVMSMIPLALAAAFVFLLAKLLSVAPNYLEKAQNFMAQVEVESRKYADKVAKPVISVKGGFAGVREFFRELAQRIRR